MPRMTKHVGKAGKVDPGDGVTGGYKGLPGVTGVRRGYKRVTGARQG